MKIDPSATIHSTVYIHPNVIIGANVKIGPGCSIGYDGFEFSRDEKGVSQFTEHRGGVVIEDRVVIQANSIVARGLGEEDNTVIGRDCKIDCLVFIAHNCRIGRGNLFIAGTVIGGSVKIGKNNFFGMNSCVRSDIGDCNLIGMGAVVVNSIGDCEVWAGNPARKLRDNLVEEILR